MICRDSNLCGKRKASEAAEESNDENDMATAAKIMKPAENDGDEEANSIGFDKSIESEFKTLKSLIPRIAGKAEIGEVSSLSEVLLEKCSSCEKDRPLLAKAVKFQQF